MNQGASKDKKTSKYGYDSWKRESFDGLVCPKKELSYLRAARAGRRKEQKEGAK
jgi:hypothetical protein